MKKFLVSVTVETEVQLVIEANSEQDAANKALEQSFSIIEEENIPDVVIRNEIVELTKCNISPKKCRVLTEITNPLLKKRLKKDDET